VFGLDFGCISVTMQPKSYGAKTLKAMCAETISIPTGYITPGTPLWYRWLNLPAIKSIVGKHLTTQMTAILP
jgi:hypothetical protein